MTDTNDRPWATGATTEGSQGSQTAPEQTHYADDETLAYIAELKSKVAALEQDRRELLTLRVERCTICGEPSPTFCDEHNPEVERLRAAMNRIADKAVLYGKRPDDGYCVIQEIAVRALTKPEGE